MQCINATAKRYQHSTKKQRGVILDEFTHTTGYSRKHAAWVLTNWLRKRVFTIGGRRTIYVFGLENSQAQGQEPAQAAGHLRADIARLLKQLWAIAGGLCGKRLAPFLRDVVPVLGTLRRAPGLDPRATAKTPHDQPGHHRPAPGPRAREVSAQGPLHHTARQRS